MNTIGLSFLFLCCIMGLAAIVEVCTGNPLLYLKHTSDQTIQDLKHIDTSLQSELGGVDILWHASQFLYDKYVRRMQVSDHISFKLGCDLCKILVMTVQELFSKGKTKTEVGDILGKICINFRVEDKRVCVGLVKQFKEEVLTVLDKLILSPKEVCGVLLGSDCGSPYNPLENWNITFPKTPKPPVVPPKLPKPGLPKLQVLQLTDIHYDALYKRGSNAVCGEPMCCRADDGKPASGVAGAGDWGDYRNCDTPLWTLENLFEHLSSTKIDFIYWTGDLPAHNVWSQSRSDQVLIIQSLTKLLKKYFPKTPIYSCIGNHESAPVNSFPPPYVTGNDSISWLYSALADSWKNWLPKDTLDTIRKGAYYTVSPYPGFRIVSINMNYCNNENWWLLLNTTDPAGQLQWLISVLQSAEDNKEKVHIIGHIPPGIRDCLKAWSWNYYKIINRYESTIVGQFFGHTHYDHFEMFYDEKNLKRPIGVAYIAPSVTPFPNLNPGYRMYEIDGNYTASTWEVLDHATYILNLTDANLHHKPVWKQEYSAKKTYQMKSLFPRDWNDLLSRMKTNHTLLEVFNKYFEKSRTDGSCDTACRKRLLCSLKSGRSYDPKMCQDIGIKSLKDYNRILKKGEKNC